LRLSQQITPLIFRPEQYQIDEALAHFCNQVRQIDLVISSNVNVLSHELIYFAVQTTFLCHNKPRPCLLPPQPVNAGTAGRSKPITPHNHVPRAAIHLPVSVTFPR
jgi:hypothetical protein